MKYKVKVFMSTYNGEKYIKEQLDSLLKQIDVDVSILIRDDGSTDDTLNIIKQYKKLYNNIDFYYGENIGYKKSFLHLLTNDFKVDYYAFCDQDDVWKSNKLIEGIRKLEEDKFFNRALLYVSSLERVDENLKFLSMQSFKNLRLTIGAEFTRHRLAGCTFIFNRKLYNLIKKSYNIKELNCSHDKLISILCLASGGKIIFDKNSYILFRRYGTNTSIDGKNILKKIIKEKEKFRKNKNENSNLAKILLNYYKNDFTSDMYKRIDLYANYRTSIFKYIKLIISKDIDCGFWFYNLFIRFVILCRCF